MTKAEPSTQEFCKVTDVAAKLRIHPNTVRIKIQNGEFPGAFKLGEARNSHWLIPMADVNALVARQNSNQKEPSPRG